LSFNKYAWPTLYYLNAVYITVAQLLYYNYPINRMCCPIMSVIFGKVLYPIPIKIPPKRYRRFRGYHAYIRLRDYQRPHLPVAFSSL